ncbi:MAG: porin [Gammaproteobacteria bacterium]
MRRLNTVMDPAIACIALMLAAVGAAGADGLTTTVSGFGTLGGSFTSDSHYAYIHDPSEFRGATNQFDVGLESRVGLQATFGFGSGLSVTVQEVARERGDKTFDPATEWLYLQYEPGSDWKLRLGRVALATFLYSDSRLVGYAAPWFHSPNEVYSAEPFFYVDGGEVVWHKNVGPFRLGAQGAFGSTQVALQALGLSFTSTATDVFNVAVSLEYKDFLIRIAQTGDNGPVSVPLSANFVLSYHVHDRFTSVGTQYDDGRAIALAEWTRRSENDAPLLNEPFTESSQWYVAGGWRFGKFTPLAIYGHIHQEQSLLGSPRSWSTVAASLRYDVVHNIALKAQVSRPQASNSTYWVTGSAASGERVNVYSVGADFVF